MSIGIERLFAILQARVEAENARVKENEVMKIEEISLEIV